MEEISSDTTHMQTAVSLQPEQSFRDDFNFRRDLPENLRKLEDISWNFYWAWQPEGTKLFRELAPGLWDRCEQNPRQLLRKIKGIRLWQKSNDEDYVNRLNNFYAKFDSKNIIR